MAGTAERSVGMKETKGWRWNKQRRGRRGRDENIFFCASLAVLHSGPIISWAVLRALCSITGNTAAHPPQQNNIQPTSHLDTTWQTETLKYGGGGVGAESGRAEGAKWAWVQLIVTVMKPLVKTATCQETTNAKEHKINTALTLIVPGKMCYLHLYKDIKAHLIFMKLLRGYRDCCQPQGPSRDTLYYHIKT